MLKIKEKSIKSKKRLLILGSSGLLGNYLFKTFKKSFKVFGSQHEKKK